MIRAICVVWLVLGAAGMSWAQPGGALGSQSAHALGVIEEAEEDEHAPRHGGYFGDADDLYHYEVLLEETHRLVLYVNDEHNRPLDVRTLEGRWTLNPDAPAPTSGIFRPSEDGAHFLADLPPVEAETLHVEVAVLKDGEWARLEYYLPLR